MKRASFEVAKAIKEAGYQQDISECNEGYAISEVRYKVYSSRDNNWYPSSADTGHMLSFDGDYYYPKDCGEYCVAPYYMDVWLWLWREKKSAISLVCDEHELINSWYVSAKKLTGDIGSFTEQIFFNDPEEAIIAAIEYLVEHNLIK